MKNQKIFKKRLDQVSSDLDRVVTNAEDAIRRAKRSVQSLAGCLAREEKKTSMDFDEVKALECYYRDDNDFLFVGARKFRVESHSSRLSIEKSKQGIWIWITKNGNSECFNLGNEEADELKKWLNK